MPRRRRPEHCDSRKGKSFEDDAADEMLLASTPRRKILAYLSETELSAGDIASRFDMTKPSLSKHLKILEAAGLVKADKRGQFVFYSLQKDSLTNTLTSFVQQVCPVSTKLRKESKAIATAKTTRPGSGNA